MRMLKRAMLHYLFLPLLCLIAAAQAFSPVPASVRSKTESSRVIVRGLLDDVSLPSAKSLDLPSMDLKAIKLPAMDLPTVDLPDFSSVTLPSIDMPAMSFNMPGIDPSVVLPALGLLAAAVVLSSLSGGGSTASGSSAGARRGSKPSPLSIPYDAAARAAYDQWLADTNSKSSEAGYAYFKELYELKAVAEVSTKKLTRDLAAFENQPKPQAKRRVVTRVKQVVTAAAPELFFAKPMK